MTLEQRLAAAHAAGDAIALIEVYTEAAEAAPDVDTACFFLTHAYVFALEAGDARAELLRTRLAAHGREPA
ncbi:MAG: hypothetical protein AAGF60_14520 [Pseudomonadota bacterium]